MKCGMCSIDFFNVEEGAKQLKTTFEGVFLIYLILITFVAFEQSIKM